MQFNDTMEKSKAQVTAFNAKTVEFAEEATKAAFAFTREALNAKTPEALWSVQQNFLKAQQEAAVRQTEAMSKFYADWLKDTSSPMAEAFKPFLAAFTKSA